MATHSTSQVGERITSGNRVQVHPANGADTYTVRVTDIGSWGLTARLGSRLIFLPWSAIDRLDRIDEPVDDKTAWCPASVFGDDGQEGCDLRLGHPGAHIGETTGRRFGSTPQR